MSRYVVFWTCATAGIWKLLVILLSLCICLPSFWHLIFFTLSQFLLPSLHATPHYRNSWYSLSLTHPLHLFLPLFLSLPDTISSSSLASRSHLIVSLFLNTFMSPLLHLSHSLCPEISTAPMTSSLLLLPSGEWYSFLSSYKSFDLLRITNRDFSYLHIASFSLSYSLSHSPSSSFYIRYLSPRVQKIDRQQTVVAPRWRLCQSRKNYWDKALTKRWDAAVWRLQKMRLKRGFATDSYSLTSITLLHSLFTVLSSLSCVHVLFSPQALRRISQPDPLTALWSTACQSSCTVKPLELQDRPSPGRKVSVTYTPRDYDARYLLHNQGTIVWINK